MKVLVTGAAGFLGGELVARLLHHGYPHVRCFTRAGSPLSRLERLAAEYPNARVEFVAGNMVAREDVERAVADADLIFHLAAAMKGSAADMFLNTVVGTRRLLDAVGDRPVKVVLVSSFGVYGVASMRAGEILDEESPLESAPERRDPYSYSKWRQETLFRDECARRGVSGVVVRAGVIYGPGGSPLSARVGVNVFGLFLSLGGRNPLPLTYVTNCAEALVCAARADVRSCPAVNVCDDDLPTCSSYLRRYRRDVQPLRVMAIPYPLMRAISRGVESYALRSRGQMPAVFTPYRTASLWKRTRFSNARLKSIGWRQVVSTEEGLQRSFAHWRGVLATGG